MNCHELWTVAVAGQRNYQGGNHINDYKKDEDIIQPWLKKIRMTMMPWLRLIRMILTETPRWDILDVELPFSVSGVHHGGVRANAFTPFWESYTRHHSGLPQPGQRQQRKQQQQWPQQQQWQQQRQQ